MMMKYILTLVVLSLNLYSSAQERNLLTSAYTLDFLRDNLVSRENYQPFPQASSDQWESIAEWKKKKVIDKAEAYLDYAYPSVLASSYLDFERTGNRSRFRPVYNTRREVLSTLILAEVFEGQSRFMDAIANGIWAICEESTWVIPAHIGVQKAGTGLPDVSEPVTGIVGAETPSLFAAAEYFLAGKLDSISPRIRERMGMETEKRFLDVMYQRDDFWWMGYKDSFTNNWNPWVISNYLNTVLIFVEDADMRARHVYKAMDILDNFLNIYPSDGGCDEGPAYWNHAAGRAFLCLDQLYMASNGSIDIYDNELIRNMGDYIWKAYIHNSWFVNFADAPAMMRPDPSLVYRYGKRVESSQMKALGAMFFIPGSGIKISSTGLMLKTLPELFSESELEAYTEEFKVNPFIVLPDLEFMAAREYENTSEGLYFAMKGGFNNESHNHNDAGNFIVYLNGQPLLADAGVGEYTAKTFSPERYDIWTMQSTYHNLPDINGYMQEFGSRYRATDFSTEQNKNTLSCSVELQKAYPQEAGIKKYLRRISLDKRKSRIQCEENFQFNGPQNEIIFHFLLPEKPELQEKSIIIKTQGSESRDARLTYPAGAEILVDEIDIDDIRLERSWGKKLYRLNIRYQINAADVNYRFSIETLDHK